MLCAAQLLLILFFFSSRRRHTRCYRDWSSDVCSADLRRWWRCSQGNAIPEGIGRQAFSEARRAVPLPEIVGARQPGTAPGQVCRAPTFVLWNRPSQRKTVGAKPASPLRLDPDGGLTTPLSSPPSDRRAAPFR